MKKKEILASVAVLIKENDIFMKDYKKYKESDLVDILAQCQEVAILLGENLEIKGKIFEPYVHLLEDYCENLYQMSKGFSDENVIALLSYRIHKQLSDMVQNITINLPDDKKIFVFLPYKSSMWDSLESVWRAAKEDPDCDAYVVPIPYYERNSKGELSIEHYEGNQFPKDVPIVNYLNFSLSVLEPDVVFIHNPYDQYNLVTSIHPAYYITELKKYAKKVAYIPYYISAETDSDSLEVQQQKEGYVLTPGVMEADMVFVQSEGIKRLYVNILEKSFPKVERSYWEKKIFGLGSPKLDRVHRAKRDDNRLEAKWHNLLYDNTGRRKKVIFYNTSLNAMLNQENMMEKIADTLEFFRKQKDLLLWWRPHPLYESTLSSMRPNLLARYQHIVEIYEKEAWGILDKGEDLEWAIAETDRYYGDRSSVVQLYLEAGKPVLIQDARVINSEEVEKKIPIWPCTFCVDGDDVWFVHGKMNLLMKFHKPDESVEIIGSIPGECFFQESLYQAMYKCEDKIYLIPCWAREIAVYDTSCDKFTKIRLDKIEDYNDRLLFCKCFGINQELYCIPYSYKAIVRIDLQTQEISYNDLNYLAEDSNGIYLGDAVLMDRKIVCTWNRSNHLLVIDLSDGQMTLRTVGEKGCQFTKISGLDNQLVLYDSFLKNIVIKSLNDGGSRIVANMSSDSAFKISAVNDDIIMVDMADSDEVICIDQGGRILYNEKKQSIGKKYNLDSNFKCGIMIRQFDLYFYFSITEYVLYAFDSSGIKEKYDFAWGGMNANLVEMMVHTSLKREEIENEVLSLPLWLSKNEIMVRSEIPYSTCGEEIKKIMKQSIL